MSTQVDKIRKWKAVVYTNLLCAPLLLCSIYWIGDYGVALFVLIPFLMGLCSSVLYCHQREVRLAKAVGVSFLTLAIFSLCIFAFAIEGLICLVMAAPFAFLLCWIGAMLGHTMTKRKPGKAYTLIILITFLIPISAFKQQNIIPPLKPVTTKIIIDAPVDIVWDKIISFPQLDEPNELIFKVGISYPISSNIEGEGVGAIRYCNFNTGAFIEPITVWEENKKLGFDVLDQPEPLTELSFWDINAPHLHDYFVSKKGQFVITELEDGKIELEGTTWYYHKIKPDFYWRLWSNIIIHKIHDRVLLHIKEIAEAESKATN